MALTKIVSGAIATDAVDTAEIASAAVESDEIAAGAVTSTQLGSAAIQQGNINATMITSQSELTTAADDDVLLIYDTDAAAYKKIQASNLTLKVPTVTSISPSSIVEDGSTVTTVTITGTDFVTGGSFNVSLVPDDSSGNVAPATVTFVSATSVTFQCTAGQLAGGVKDPWDVAVTNANGLTGIGVNLLDVNPTPTFDQAAGSLGTIISGARTGLSFDASATDEGTPLTGTNAYAIASGSLPDTTGASTPLALNTTTGEIAGDVAAVGSNTTSNFTISATDGINTNHRAFSLLVNAPASTSFTADTTWTVPTGLTAVEVLVVAAGGGGGCQHGGGGGGGGLIYQTDVVVTPGGTVTIDIGAGGTNDWPAGPTYHQGTSPQPGTLGPGTGGSGTTVLNGQNTVFGSPTDPGIGAPAILTALGGGYGGGWSGQAGNAGGSGGAGTTSAAAGAATQPTAPGNSGTYGFGYAGGPSTTASGAGGGGAGAVGGVTTPGSGGGPGGAGKAYTIADGTTSVYYSGGGGGGDHGSPNAAGTGGQGGGGAGGQYSGPAQAQYNYGHDGQANTGGGGGGSASGTSDGGYGGSGIIVVRY